MSLNESIRKTDENCELIGCLGQRHIAANMARRSIRIDGVPEMRWAHTSTALPLPCTERQDAVGDTMNDGRIIVHGNVGDAVGYAMRSGEIFVKGNAGYRAASI